MTVPRLLAIGAIIACTAFAWFLLGGALTVRSESTNERLWTEVQGNWGEPMDQLHPRFYYISPTSVRAQRMIQPASSRINVDLSYDPKKKGLLWYRTYRVDFAAEYLIRNPTPITQTIYLNFDFPAEGTRFDLFTLAIGEKGTDKAPTRGSIKESVILAPGAEIPVTVTYRTSGMNEWRYSFGDTPRVHDLELKMKTNFGDINIPAGTESPTPPREQTAEGWNLIWEYSDVIGARSIGMDMPAVVNPGPVAARITFFAPISLLFFFAVLVIIGTVRGVNLHPINYFFLAAGCFAFQLLFAYLVDLIPVMVAFSAAAGISLVLVTGYLWRVAGGAFARIAAIAQFAFMVLFSYSFFFRGLTGITIAAGAVVTLALLMGYTAKLDWEKIFVGKRRSGDSQPDEVVLPSTPPPLS